MTWYELTVRRYDTNPATGAQDDGKTMSHLESDDEGVIAATMRRIADRLDPPQPVRPTHRAARRPRAMDAPDAVLSTAAAEVVARVEADQDEAIMARMRQRLTPATGRKAGAPMPRSRGSRITPDGCGPEHTFTGSCFLAGQGRP